MPITVYHEAPTLTRNLLAYLAGRGQAQNRNKAIANQQKFEGQQAMAQGVATGVSNFTNRILDLQDQKIREQREIARIQEAAKAQQQNQIALAEKEAELELQGKGYALDYTEQQKHEMAQLDADEMRVRQSLARDEISPEQADSAMMQIQRERGAIKKVPIYKGPKPPTAKERWDSGDAGFVDERGVYMMVNPKTGGLEPHDPPKNNAAEQQAKAQAESIKNFQNMAAKQEEARLKAVEKQQTIATKQAESEIKIRQKALDLAIKSLTKKVPGEDGKMVEQPPTMDDAVAYADILYRKIALGENPAPPPPGESGRRADTMTQQLTGIPNTMVPPPQGMPTVKPTNPKAQAEARGKELIEISKQQGGLTAEQQAELAQIIQLTRGQ